MSEPLDSIDRTIIRLLRLNARRPNSEIATEVGLSASACHRRIRILEERGVIRGYTVITGSGEEDERGVDVLVQVTLDRQTEEYLSKFEHAVRQCPEIRECFLMTGDVDYWLRVRTDSVAAYETIHGEILSRMPGVTRISSSFAMRDALRPKRSGRR
ncbi:Lrp/AsnC family transcriptional regulator [Novosphingobium aerophilum]|uniref:Lrp/AsnC family transcriptional regulator n=1 Tax=Novosphingobium TaxID=165696 RepID=UPI0006C83BE7|nr:MULTISPECIES: Lrp/AsnC family transcriptional regulator [unclassified Novosphingobium]KPH61837.1 transcriptional regulator [Novosphingobium sp. ST904]MPS68876.1 Lrp/AsnC family transcriptional regulator [Novosphingobium sp.]TCM34414.1 AsnC family transcriptional regulator [Novosphingobium sp. ST904]WRT96083.1 Lrp/AsnC family transcriptional regulator [Novosphingobium sp. RL4]